MTRKKCFIRLGMGLGQLLVAVVLLAFVHGVGNVSADSDYTLSGQLTDQNGNPISGATLIIRDANGDSGTGTTDSSGDYSITTVPGTYYINGFYLHNYPNAGAGSIYNSLTQQSSSDPSINLTSGNLTQNLQVSIATIQVTVEDSSGNPVSGAAVTNETGEVSGSTSLYTGDPGENIRTLTNMNQTTNSSGIADMTSIVGTEYSGPTTSNICANISGDEVCASPFTVSGNTDITLQQPVTHTLSGQLTDQNGNPASGIVINLMSGSTIAGTATTNSDGDYSIATSPGTYSLSIDGRNYPNTDAGSIYNLLMNQDSSNPTINLTSGNVTQNLQLNTATIQVTVEDSNGNPLSGVSVTNDTGHGGGTASLYTGDPGENISLLTNLDTTTNSSGVVDMTSIVGAQYSGSTSSNICADISGSEICVSPFTVSGNTDVTIVETVTPNAPTNLTVPSPTNQAPVLYWSSASGATSYNIYRGGTEIGSTSSTTYTDSSLTSDGTYSYYVTAVNSSGESSPSNTVSVVYDTTPPTITYTVTPQADSNGYNNGKVTVTFSCSDPGSGIASCTSPVTVDNEGIGQTVTGTATDNAGNTTTITAQASLLNQAINAGGSSNGSYSSDTGYYGGTTYSSSASVDTSNVLNPAPQDVYQSDRYGNSFTYTLSGLTAGSDYTLMLHFNEPYWGVGNNGGGVGSRVFNVAVNGTTALSNYDIYKTAGGANRAITEEIPATADSNGNITLQFTSVTDNAIVSGIQLFNGTLPPQAPHQVYTFSSLINAGGSAVGNFAADSDFSGGTPYTSSANVDTSNITNPAPESVFQSARYGGSFSYTIPGLAPNSTYNVRLDFNELYWGVGNNGGGVGSRVFNVAINGTTELSNFDIYAAAGGANIGIAKDFTVTSDSQGNITIQFNAVTDSAIVSGIEVTQQ